MQDMPPETAFLMILTLIPALILLVRGLQNPYRAMRIHARVGRALAELSYGPD